jgi:hypothetical protein
MGQVFSQPDVIGAGVAANGPVLGWVLSQVLAEGRKMPEQPVAAYAASRSN